MLDYVAVAAASIHHIEECRVPRPSRIGVGERRQSLRARWIGLLQHILDIRMRESGFGRFGACAVVGLHARAVMPDERLASMREKIRIGEDEVVERRAGLLRLAPGKCGGQPSKYSGERQQRGSGPVAEAPETVARHASAPVNLIISRP